MDEDQDLSGDDPKIVNYQVVFRKRGLEAMLESGTELVGYQSDAASFAALRIAELMLAIESGAVERPRSWRDAGYPPGAPDHGPWAIPPEDRKYLGVLFEVSARYPRRPGDTDADQSRALRGIRDILDRSGDPQDSSRREASD